MSETKHPDLRKAIWQKPKDDIRDDVLPETRILDKDDGNLDTPDVDRKPEGQGSRN